ncbi:hypothetical protein KAFR_0C01540 [Kazachstania africana CBS 2517]|uniref:BHLH domain-containing protein n=1 Tax=Kazachstania africana (strain ATCC 22294 / BCRC 22015 / CBS 2517 / CECT 1963 / NBRC 1671 / NRRL Y-8276) TaxID=1071382 RepID=H2ARZ7_KAZAF|nr:hypothetical protein KAFR_0C01540 [Kazachstania africana CBS 2517]CCF57147.1 hypothetical protein KAFR_0C01540 [Kazachstania africana CBS 2517]
MKQPADVFRDNSSIDHESAFSVASINSVKKPTNSNRVEKKPRRPRAKKANKLSEDQVRLNHVSSEKKRREIVRATYDEMVNLVPDLQKDESRSELVIYLKTIKYIKWLRKRNELLYTRLREKTKDDQNFEVPKNLIWKASTTEENGQAQQD